MAFINKGTTAYIFGIDSGITISGVIQSLNITREYTNIVEARAADGTLAAKRYDDIHGTGTVTFLFEVDPGDAIGTASSQPHGREKLCKQMFPSTGHPATWTATPPLDGFACISPGDFGDGPIRSQAEFDNIPIQLCAIGWTSQYCGVVGVP